jgi:hypothetical protein
MAAGLPSWQTFADHLLNDLELDATVSAVPWLEVRIVGAALDE